MREREIAVDARFFQMRCGATIRLAAALPGVATRTASFCTMQARPSSELVKDFLKSESFAVVGATNRRDKFGNKVRINSNRACQTKSISSIRLIALMRPTITSSHLVKIHVSRRCSSAL
jgi:hypothetical protein